MKKSLKKIFTEKGVFDAAPDFEDDFEFYESRHLWEHINCFGYALGYRDAGFEMLAERIHSDISKHALRGIPRIVAHTNIVPIKDNKLQNIPQGCYPVAIFSSPEKGNRLIVRDYHWYRMNNDGTWSHKQGKSKLEATNLDANNKFITNPRKVSRKSLSGTFNYSLFLGYFAVPKGGAKFFLETQPSYADIYNHIKKTTRQKPKASKKAVKKTTSKKITSKKIKDKRKERKSNQGKSLSL